ncbi:hypothetical protein BC938DRAFT_477382, partial [Jimgerdemannia flammicorona]
SRIVNDWIENQLFTADVVAKIGRQLNIITCLAHSLKSITTSHDLVTVMAKPTYIVLPVMLAYVAQLATALNLTGQSAQSAVLINSAVYIFGGNVNKKTVANLYVLDVSQPWNCTSPAWSNYTSDTIDVPHTMNNAIWPSPDNNSFYVWGGNNNNRKPLIRSGFSQYNVVTKTWSRPINNSNIPQQRGGIVVTWTHGVAYIWGGKSDKFTGDKFTHVFDDIISFDMIKLVWNFLHVARLTPPPRVWYTATMLSDGQIVIIGGYICQQLNATTVNSTLALMSNIPVFNTKTTRWTFPNVTGSIPRRRRGHTAVL